MPRRAISFATIITIDGHRVPCQVVNLSPLGALVAARTPVRLGQKLALEIPAVGAAQGVIQRITSTHFAVAFDPPLPDGTGG